ncbi:hypothetical protein [Thiocapsa marina]|uniref:Porin n=1 Tax=Thiocapsa marina 5811 TaxID=768671 RepID=F9U8A8_9GAMM|nr:hypothetical protein [Thiocapsa marina]EGV19520.1 hypothetical protein ThimaDRAFT_0966 [Thiocapsa marina 5811]
MNRKRLIAALVASLWGSPTPAQSVWNDFQIHGFGAQAVLKTSDNRWFGDSDQTSFDFTELGVNASLRVLPELLVAGQVLARRAGGMSEGTPAIDYALADISLLDSPQHGVHVRLGRIKNPLGLYNETRDVPFTHPGIFLPQVVYFDRVRNLVLSSDGAALFGETTTDFGTFSGTLVYGQSLVDENVEWSYLNGNFPGDIAPDGNSWIGSAWFTSSSQRLKLGLSGAALALRFRPDRDVAWTLDSGTTDILYWIASAQYRAEDWSLTAEYAREPLQWRSYGPAFPDRKAVGEGYYVQATYRVRPPLQLMLTYQEGFADRQDREGNALSAATGGLAPAFSGFSKIWSLGLRWDIDEHWMVRAEYQHNEGTFILSPRENPDPDALAKYWNLFGLQVVFRF